MSNFPDIYYDNNIYNPMISSPNAPHALCFAQTRESLMGDTEIFKKFLDNAIMRFRRSVTYTGYKSHLMEHGLDRCQMMSNIIHEEMATVQMHHNGLTIFDIAIILTNHILAISGSITTYDLVLELKKVHKQNKVPLVMLSTTAHQMVHHNDEFFVPASMCFGFWTELLEDYKYGITFGIAKKLYYFIKTSMERSNDPGLNDELLKINDSIRGWSEYNYTAVNNNKFNRVNTGI